MINYRIYGNNRKVGWELLNTFYKEEKVYEFISYVNADDYRTVMVVKHIFELNEDIPFLLEYLEKSPIRSRKNERK